MSEKFNPLAEAQSNASHDRRRFYDWVGDSADHQDNEGFRAANEDMADYLSSRHYEDDNGALHSAESGKFMKNPNASYDADAMESSTANVETDRAKRDAEDYYSQMQERTESGVDARFEGKDLKDIAEMVREARETGDKTLENDARVAFDDKFMEMAEKYDWQGVVENTDGTTTDRNDIADKKLAYYEAIMNGNAMSASEPGVRGSEAVEVTQENDMPFTEADQAELNKTLEEEDAYTPKHRADNQDEETPLFEQVARENDVDPSEAKEGESLEEYEARQAGRHRAEPLPTNELDAIADGTENGDKSLPTDELDAIANSDSETIPRSRRERMADWLRHPIVTAGAEATARQINRRYERENSDDTRTRRRRLLGGFVLFGGALAGGVLLMKGHDIFGHTQNPGGGSPSGLSPSDLSESFITKAKQDMAQNIADHYQPGSAHGGGGAEGAAAGLDTIRVNPGDGEIKVTQHILEQQGIKVDATAAQKIGEHAQVDLLTGDKNYDDAGSTLNRIGAQPGTFKIRPESADALVKAARELGY